MIRRNLERTKRTDDPLLKTMKLPDTFVKTEETQVGNRETLSHLVLPSCLKVLRIRPERKFCKLGDLSNDNGWPHAKLVERLESKRKVKSSPPTPSKHRRNASE